MKMFLRFGLCLLMIFALICAPASAESKPSYNVANLDQVYEYLLQCSNDRRANVTLVCSGNLDLYSDSSKLSQIVYSLGAESFKWSFSGNQVKLIDIVYAPNFRVCADMSEAIAYVENCANRHTDSFRLYFTPSYAQTLFADGHRELMRLLANTRLSRPSEYRYSTDNRYVQFEGVDYLPADYPYAREIHSLEQFKRTFEAHTDRLDKNFGAFLEEQTVKQLAQNASQNANLGQLFDNIYSNCGVTNLQYSYSDSGYYYIRQIDYYDGKIIANAYKQGTTDQLSPRQKQTLNAALGIVSQTHGTPVEVEKQIHDMLCARIEYYTDGIAHDDNDCAVGALLNGKADCDGYSDAFYLCCSLAGLDVRYIHGTVLKREGENEHKVQSDKTHMWNLVLIDGEWLTVDVTWDDSDYGTNYQYFNLGAERASGDHIWDDTALNVNLKGVPSPSQRVPGLREVNAYDWDGIYEALRLCAIDRADRLSIVHPSWLKVYENSDRLSRLVYSVGVESFSWSFSDNAVELYNIRYGGEFTICASADDIISAVNAYAARGTGSFKLCFTPELADLMFADGHAAFRNAILRTKLKSPCVYSYNTSSSYIMYTDALWHDSLSIAEVSTIGEVETYINSFAAQKASHIRLICKNGLDLYSGSNDLSRILRNAGIKDFNWLFYTSNDYVEVFDIEY